MIAQAEKRLILPEYLRPQPKIRCQRSPLRVRCGCGRVQVIILPNAPCHLAVTCPCGRSDRRDFRPVGEETPGEYEGPLAREPFEHGCPCGRKTILVLPAGEGELRWDCPCGSGYGIIFDRKTVNLYGVA